MALTGNTVQSTYLDLVQLEQSGAGLPSHAGKEAALYDGSGAQILGRSAVRNWLDPHPDAASFDETWEFSTTGDMNQSALESAGWTFSNCTASVSGGLLNLTTTANGIISASIVVELTGDFDIVITPSAGPDYYASSVGTPKQYYIGGGGIADYRAGVADVSHYGLAATFNGRCDFHSYITGAFTTLGGTLESDVLYGSSTVCRTLRDSGTVYNFGATAGNPRQFFLYDYAATTKPAGLGWTSTTTTASDSSTFNKLFLTQGPSNFTLAGCVCSFASVRRFK